MIRANHHGSARTRAVRALVATAGLAASLGVVAPATAVPVRAGGGGEERPTAYQLTGDPEGSKFEGIGTDERRGVFYVSETTGGEIHRGHARTAQTEEWLGGDGTDGRWTARGIDVDRAGRIFIAGGPNALQNVGAPDVWIYAADGRLLAALRLPGTNVFVNDVAIGPDGAAYFTNSNAPQVFRVARSAQGWGATLFADGTGTIPQLAGFNLGGIVVTADRSALVVAQGNAGALWRIDLASAAVTAVDTGGADLVGADGLVRRGDRLKVVRNFQRMVATLELTGDGARATLLRQRPTDPTRVLTTAKVLRGRILYVDSKFDEPVAAPPYEVVTDPFVD